MERIEAAAVAIVLVAAHLASPLALRLKERARREVSSFSGGLAAAYICLHLIPEIDAGGALLGGRIYFLLFVGLAGYFGLEVAIQRRHEGRPSSRGTARFALHLGIAAIYSFLLIYTLSHKPPATPMLTAVFAITMALHLLSSDTSLQETYGARFVRLGRFVLAGAIVLGFLAGQFGQDRTMIVDVLTALLAGFMLFTVFRKELPETGDVHFRAFLLGAGVFLLAHVLLGEGGG